MDASPPLTCHSFSVRPEARFSVPTRGRPRQPRAGAVKAGRLGGHPQGSALTAPSTAAGFERSGLKSLGPRQIERFRGPVAGHDIALRYAHHRRNRGLAAGGVTRMGRDAGRRLGRAARSGPRDSTRSRPLAAASRPSLYLSSRPHGRSATHAYRRAPFLTELGLTPIQVAEIFHEFSTLSTSQFEAPLRSL